MKLTADDKKMESLYGQQEKESVPGLEMIEEYFSSLNLGDYDLGGCEFAEDDFKTVLKRMEDGGKDLKEVVHQYLLEIREILDEGLEEDMDPMDKSVESWADVQEKYPMDREEMHEDEEIHFIEDCFKIYEKEGFSSVFWSPFTDNEERKGQKFEVVKRCSAEDRDLCTLPMWKIKFPDGKVIDAYPEEIIPSEMRANGCRWFDDKSSSLDSRIQSASTRAGDSHASPDTPVKTPDPER